jgi:cytoskeletal protein RodZ
MHKHKTSENGNTKKELSNSSERSRKTMKQSKLIAPAFAAAMLLTGCGGRNHNNDRNNDMNRFDDTPTATASPRQQYESSIRRSNESAMDDIARNSERNDTTARDNRVRDNVDGAMSDIAKGGRKIASDVVSDAREAVNDVVDGREDNDGTYRADENGDVND